MTKLQKKLFPGIKTEERKKKTNKQSNPDTQSNKQKKEPNKGINITTIRKKEKSQTLFSEPKKPEEIDQTLLYKLI